MYLQAFVVDEYEKYCANWWKATSLTSLQTKSWSFPIILRDSLISSYFCPVVYDVLTGKITSRLTGHVSFTMIKNDDVLLFFCQAQINWCVTRHLLLVFCSGNLQNSVQCNISINVISLLTLSIVKLKLFWLLIALHLSHCMDHSHCLVSYHQAVSSAVAKIWSSRESF